MKKQMLSQSLSRILVILLSITYVLPNPVFALHTQSPLETETKSGLEESLTKSTLSVPHRSKNPAAGLEEAKQRLLMKIAGIARDLDWPQYEILLVSDLAVEFQLDSSSVVQLLTRNEVEVKNDAVTVTEQTLPDLQRVLQAEELIRAAVSKFGTLKLTAKQQATSWVFDVANQNRSTLSIEIGRDDKDAYFIEVSPTVDSPRVRVKLENPSQTIDKLKQILPELENTFTFLSQPNFAVGLEEQEVVRFKVGTISMWAVTAVSNQSWYEGFILKPQSGETKLLARALGLPEDSSLVFRVLRPRPFGSTPPFSWIVVEREKKIFRIGDANPSPGDSMYPGFTVIDARDKGIQITKSDVSGSPAVIEILPAGLEEETYPIRAVPVSADRKIPQDLPSELIHALERLSDDDVSNLFCMFLFGYELFTATSFSLDARPWLEEDTLEFTYTPYSAPLASYSPGGGIYLSQSSVFPVTFPITPPLRNFMNGLMHGQYDINEAIAGLLWKPHVEAFAPSADIAGKVEVFIRRENILTIRSLPPDWKLSSRAIVGEFLKPLPQNWAEYITRVLGLYRTEIKNVVAAGYQVPALDKVDQAIRDKDPVVTRTALEKVKSELPPENVQPSFASLRILHQTIDISLNYLPKSKKGNDQQDAGLEEVGKWIQSFGIWSKPLEAPQLTDLQSNGEIIAEVRGMPSVVRLTGIDQGLVPSAEVSHTRQVIAQAGILPDQTIAALTQRFGLVESLPSSLNPSAIGTLAAQLRGLDAHGPKALLIVDPDTAEQLKTALAEIDPQWEVPVVILGIPAGLLTTTHPNALLTYLLNLLAQADKLPGRHMERLEGTFNSDTQRQTFFLSTGA